MNNQFPTPLHIPLADVLARFLALDGEVQEQLLKAAPNAFAQSHHERIAQRMTATARTHAPRLREVKDGGARVVDPWLSRRPDTSRRSGSTRPGGTNRPPNRQELAVTLNPGRFSNRRKEVQ